MDSIISKDELIKPTMNVLLAISTAIANFEEDVRTRMDNEKKMPHFDDDEQIDILLKDRTVVNNQTYEYIMSLLREHVVSFVQGDISMRAGYFPTVYIAESVDNRGMVLTNAVPDINVVDTRDRERSHYVVPFCSYHGEYYLCGEHLSHEEYKIAINNEKLCNIIIEWERRPLYKGPRFLRQAILNHKH
jgi:hypothetical protein